MRRSGVFCRQDGGAAWTTRQNSLALEAGWQPRSVPKLRPWLRAGYSRSSGDKDATDSEHGTFSRSSPRHVPMPAFLLQDDEQRRCFTELAIRPIKGLSIRSDLHSLRLTQGSDLWYLGGGAFQTCTFGYQGRATAGARGLATLYDVSADYTLNPHSPYRRTTAMPGSQRYAYDLSEWEERQLRIYRVDGQLLTGILSQPNRFALCAI